MKRIFLFFIISQSFLFSYDNIIGTIVFEDKEYFVNGNGIKDGNKKKELKELKVIPYNEVNKTSNKQVSNKSNTENKDISVLYNKRNELKRRGIKFLVWSDRERENYKVVDILLTLEKLDINKVEQFTFVSSKDFTFLHSKTGLIYVSPESSRSSLMSYIDKKTKDKDFKLTKKMNSKIDKKVIEPSKERKEDLSSEDIQMYKANAEKLRTLFNFRGIENENNLFIELVKISDKELPILYNSIIIPNRDGIVKRDSKRGIIYLDTRSNRDVIFRNLQK